MKKGIYLLVAFVTLICGFTKTFGQADPGSTGMSFDKSSFQTNETGTLDVNIGNFSSATAVGPGDALFTVNLPSSMRPNGVTDLSFMPFNVTIVSQNTNGGGTTIIVFGVPNGIPANTNGVFSIPVIGFQVSTSLNATLTVEPNVTTASGNALTTNDNQSSPVIVTAPLPVTLTSFTATKEGQTAQLKWSTTAETNSDRFEIERSQNGKNWDLIGTRKSNGESATLKNYTFSDGKPLDGENLYRLKMIDKDMTFAYSRIQSLTFASDLATSFYPNPVAEKLIIKTDDFSLVKNVKIFDANGRTVYQSSATPSSEINVQNLSTGLYIVQMVSKSGAVISHKVIKQ